MRAINDMDLKRAMRGEPLCVRKSGYYGSRHDVALSGWSSDPEKGAAADLQAGDLAVPQRCRIVRTF